MKFQTKAHKLQIALGKRSSRLSILGVVSLQFALVCIGQDFLPNTQPLTMEGDLSARMVDGIQRFLSEATDRSIVERQRHWKRNFSSREAYESSIQPNRDRFRRILGAMDQRLPVTKLEFVSDTDTPAVVAETDLFTVREVRWPVFENVCGEGLWLRPKREPVARVIAVPDADQTPEMVVGIAPGLPPESQFARRLAENGCEVIVPLLIDRSDNWSGSAALQRFTNQPHREWIYRQAFELGRHVIGFEAQKVLAAVEFFKLQESPPGLKMPRIGVAGYAEGGLLAFYATALDTNIDAVLVSGYFGSKQRVWEEPIYRNVFGLLEEFGDAEIASLIAPRLLVVEHSPVPNIEGPPKASSGRSGAAPGRLRTPDFPEVEQEFERARALLANGGPSQLIRFKLVSGVERTTTGPGSDHALIAFLNGLGVPVERLGSPGQAPVADRPIVGSEPRQRRQVKQLEDYCQKLLRWSEEERSRFFWKNIKAASPEQWASECAQFKDLFYDELIGRFTQSMVASNPRSRKIQDLPKWTCYEVVLDVYPDVFAWGYLLVPKDIKPGERRPVVVCQHGLEGLPSSVIDENRAGSAFGFYKAFAARLAEQGFVVFAPHNPYRGGDAFRQLQRLANPLKKSLFSIIIPQQARVMDWLPTLPYVDPERIAFYGLSYGGKTAMRVPAVLNRYCLSICSADFNDWVRKNVTVESPYGYIYTGEYEMPEWNLGNTFSYAEMAALIAPRPFMVERGHGDGVAPDEWVAYEYAKVRRFYDRLGIGERTAIEFFNGPHTINGVGTFDFLHRHLNWPVPQQ